MLDFQYLKERCSMHLLHCSSKTSLSHSVPDQFTTFMAWDNIQQDQQKETGSIQQDQQESKLQVHSSSVCQCASSQQYLDFSLCICSGSGHFGCLLKVIKLTLSSGIWRKNTFWLPVNKIQDQSPLQPYENYKLFVCFFGLFQYVFIFVQ